MGSLVFTFITLPNTYINGKNVSFASRESALEEVGERFDLEVSGRDDRKLNLDSDQIDYNAKIPANASIDQNPFAWPLNMVGLKKDQLKFDYKISYDEEKLDEILKGSPLFTNITEPEDAGVVFKGNSFELKDAVMGNKLDYTKVKDDIIRAISTDHKDIKLEDDFYESPTVLSDSPELKALEEDAKKIEAMNIKFNFNGFDLKLKGEDLVNMIYQEGEKFQIDYDKLMEFMAGIADETDTYGKDRKFNATGIGEIVVNPGVYGFVLDQAATGDEVLKLFNQRKSGDVEPVYERYAYNREEDGSDLGNTYIEVDISRQYMWFYKNGELIVESPLVTGINQGGWQTNVGVGSILSKNTNTTLEGVGFVGDRYKTPVRFWMPIGWDGEGFHDADWRYSFGGDIYQYDGSHGCLNLPPSVAEIVFNNVEVHTPVVVYESSTNNSPAMIY